MSPEAPHPLGRYVGRFAPSPSGPLHAGSLVAALASFLDARAHEGQWLIRIEDIDTPRTIPGADRIIVQQLATLGMVSDGPVVWQSQRLGLYEQAFARLQAAGRVYGCTCTRRELPPGSYPGTCRPRAMQSPASGGEPRMAAGTDAQPPAVPGRCPRKLQSWRFLVEPGVERFEDRWLGPQAQDVEHEVGDFIIRRADGPWAYQLAVVVDDGAQGVTDIVRGADLLDSTGRQRQLARALGLSSPGTLHVPLVLDTAGHKLSKQNHAPALQLNHPLQDLQRAWLALGFSALETGNLETFWAEATRRWAGRNSIRQPN